MKSVLMLLMVMLCLFVEPVVLLAQPVRAMREIKVRQPYPENRMFRMEIQYDISQTIKGDLSKFHLTAVVPSTIAGRQQVKVMMTPRPTKTWRENGVSYAKWEFNEPDKDFKVRMVVTGRIFRRDLYLLSKNNSVNQGEMTSEQLLPFLKEERCVYFKNNEVSVMAAKIPNGKNRIQTVKNIHDAVINHMKNTGYMLDAKGSVFAAKTGEGDCTEYSDLMVALCRSKGIPARVVAGLVTTWFDTPKHNWLEVYFPRLGWVPFDALHAETGAASFTSLQNKYIYLSAVRNDENLKNYYYWCYVFWGKRPEIKSTVTMLSVTGQKKLPKSAEY